MTFVSEPGSLPFSHKQSPCSQKGTALQTQPHRGRRKEVTADCPRTFPWKTIPGRNNQSTVVYRSKLPTPLPPHFLNLQLSRRNVLTSMSTLHLLRKIITRGKLQNVLSVLAFSMDEDHCSHIHLPAASPGRLHTADPNAAGTTLIEISRHLFMKSAVQFI